MKFKLITCIDRINYLSDVFINYYKRIFNNDEFYFLIDSRYQNVIRPYLDKHVPGYGYKLINRDSFGNGFSHIQNPVKTAFISQGYIVVYADIDELIYHPNLKEYIINSDKQLILAQGVVLFQHPSEAPLDKNKKILDQRGFCKLSNHFSKVCILKKDFQWTPGRHNKPPGLRVDGNVFIVDISKMCNNLISENNADNRKIYKSLTKRYSTNSPNEVLKEWNLFIYEKMIEIPKVIKECSCF